ncbi:hypothetical protein NKH18_00515 [Streptomyces sp. M10(2022)]
MPLELGNPLQLSKTMRARLLAAVRALVLSPALANASDGARLASVVLTAKAKVSNNYQAKIWAAELGRWMGSLSRRSRTPCCPSCALPISSARTSRSTASGTRRAWSAGSSRCAKRRRPATGDTPWRCPAPSWRCC